jgi:hypothetical protein
MQSDDQQTHHTSYPSPERMDSLPQSCLQNTIKITSSLSHVIITTLSHLPVRQFYSCFKLVDTTTAQQLP